MRHLKKFNEAEGDELEEDRSPVKVKDIISYLSTLDPEADVHLDKDGWQYDVDDVADGVEILKNSGVFHIWYPTRKNRFGHTEKGRGHLTINN